MSKVIVAGHIITKRGCRDDFVAGSRDTMVAARNTPGCTDFVVTADPLEADRVHIFEAWDDETYLKKFRGDGPGDELSRLIERADVGTFNVLSNK
ncbi:MAG: hypothetical protein R3D45_09115 [Rhizobiaceae bacterium]